MQSALSLRRSLSFRHHSLLRHLSSPSAFDLLLQLIESKHPQDLSDLNILLSFYAQTSSFKLSILFTRSSFSELLLYLAKAASSCDSILATSSLLTADLLISEISSSFIQISESLLHSYSTLLTRHPIQVLSILRRLTLSFKQAQLMLLESGFMSKLADFLGDSDAEDAVLKQSTLSFLEAMDDSYPLFSDDQALFCISAGVDCLHSSSTIFIPAAKVILGVGKEHREALLQELESIPALARLLSLQGPTQFALLVRKIVLNVLEAMGEISQMRSQEIVERIGRKAAEEIVCSKEIDAVVLVDARILGCIIKSIEESVLKRKQGFIVEPLLFLLANGGPCRVMRAALSGLHRLMKRVDGIHDHQLEIAGHLLLALRNSEDVGILAGIGKNVLELAKRGVQLDYMECGELLAAIEGSGAVTDAMVVLQSELEGALGMKVVEEEEEEESEGQIQL